jgi:hypothetical protein
MSAVPAPTPVTAPLDELTVAIDVLDEVQTPLGVPLEASVLLAPTHMVVVPVIVPPVAEAVIVIFRRALKDPQPFGAVV